MPFNIESPVVIYPDTNYHTIISNFQVCPLEICKTDDVSFATTSLIESDHDIERKKIIIKVWRYTEINENGEEYENAYSRAKSIEMLELQMIASFCKHDLVSYKWNLLRCDSLLYFKVYGLSLKSIIFPKKELLVVEIDSVVVEIENLKIKIKSKKLILNNCQINTTMPARVFSKTGIFNVREQCNVNIFNEEDVLYHKEVSTNCLNYICSDKFNTLKIYNINTQENKFSRKTFLGFDDLTDYMPKIKAKIIEISLTRSNYSKIIENMCV